MPHIRSPIRLIVVLLGLATTSAAAIDVNHATRAELESISGVGPTLAEQILAQRDREFFKNWRDLIDRVKGLGPASAAQLSNAGLSVGGARYSVEIKP